MTKVDLLVFSDNLFVSLSQIFLSSSLTTDSMSSASVSFRAEKSNYWKSTVK